MSPEDLDRVTEALHRFDEFILEAETTEIWCGRCSQFVMAGVLRTEAAYQVARCKCRTEIRPLFCPTLNGRKVFSGFTQQDWDIFNDIDTQTSN